MPCSVVVFVWSVSGLRLEFAASRGCTLHQIAAALYRADGHPERPSKVEGQEPWAPAR